MLPSLDALDRAIELTVSLGLDHHIETFFTRQDMSDGLRFAADVRLTNAVERIDEPQAFARLAFIFGVHGDPVLAPRATRRFASRLAAESGIAERMLGDWLETIRRRPEANQEALDGLCAGAMPGRYVGGFILAELGAGLLGSARTTRAGQRPLTRRSKCSGPGTGRLPRTPTSPSLHLCAPRSYLGCAV